jgi:Zn-finger in ubiquitin-hydrolases and other protein
MGDTWVHLRACLICGHVGCCDSSKNKHATAHFHATSCCSSSNISKGSKWRGHPLVQSFDPGEDWLWFYVDQVMREPA